MPETRHKLSYRKWQPSLDNGHMTLREVLDSMPAAPANAIPFAVKMFENPEPPVGFWGLLPLPGYVSLVRHDAIHALLARGLLPQDEAFVIGFTMGSDPKTETKHLKLFKFVSRFLYPRAYGLDSDDLISFDLGVSCGMRNGKRDVRNYPFEDALDRTMDDLRKELGLSKRFIRSYIAMEKIYLPFTSESRHLDDLSDTDTSRLYK